MFDLDWHIVQWRRQLHVAPDIADELESHLREAIEARMRAGMSAQEAFQFSVEEMGEPRLLLREFGRVPRHPLPVASRAAFKLAAVYLAAVTFLVAILPVIGVRLTVIAHVQVLTLLALFMLGLWIYKFFPRATSAPVNLARFTPAARHTLDQAKLEAQRLHHDFIGTEHSLLGLMEHEPVARIFHRLQITREMIQREVERLVPAGSAQQMAFDPPCTPRLRQALLLAAAEAPTPTEVGAEYLLLGLLKEGTGVAAFVLKNLGVRIEDLRREIKE